MIIRNLTQRALSPAQRTDVEYGWPHLLALAKFGVGRTLLVKNRAVLSVESIEGVADAIRRAGTVCTGGYIVLVNGAVAVEPVEPIDTRILQTMIDSGASALAVSRDYPFVEREAVLRFADQKKIAIVEIP